MRIPSRVNCPNEFYHRNNWFALLVIQQYKPTDATTNPSLLYAAAQQPEYDSLFKDAIEFAKKTSR